LLSPDDQLSEALRQSGGNIRSPIVMSGIMIQILRHRFDARFNIPFKWLPLDPLDPVNKYKEHPDSSVRIEQGGESTRDAGYVKPGVYVRRQPVHVQQLVLDDQSSMNLMTGDKSYLARGNTGFTFICEAADEGVSSTLADLVMSTFVMSASIIERSFNLHKLGPFSLSATSSLRKEKEVYETHVSVGLQYDMKWANLNLAPMFKELVLKSSDNIEYFFETYTKSLT